ncbi:hypothetical protein HUG15_13730 [Salicibibacter cibarius]|uniref:Uncharacterized protein n=1 Tax=Salicibibacter cibarius TaxID=2743000 RepID=A0A7T7CC54_9BACI|nr:hypothetical protein HUG15_13730 [Salicibibacter cibarius]
MQFLQLNNHRNLKKQCSLEELKETNRQPLRRFVSFASGSTYRYRVQVPNAAVQPVSIS